MAFGDRTKTYAAKLTREEFFSDHPQQKLPRREVAVEAVPAPDWWSEYLMEEWKRTHIRQARRESRTSWQQSQDAWALQALKWSPDQPHHAEVPPCSLWGPVR